MGRSGGFPKNGRGTDPDHKDLASVGCESCHGPGGNHIAPSAKKLGTIVSLADKCDSCAILQICGSCHDEANDPGFEFEVEEKIELQRHGTIEAGNRQAPAPEADGRSQRRGSLRSRRRCARLQLGRAWPGVEIAAMARREPPL